MDKKRKKEMKVMLIVVGYSTAIFILFKHVRQFIKHRASFLLCMMKYYVFRDYRKPFHPEAHKALQERADNLHAAGIRKYEEKWLRKFLQRHPPANLNTEN
ncbi:MAG: hypothetical protein PHT07_14840 [Paludibacter sp.]|nr:hypothetical protein [Paludibacter sp.]